MKRDVLIVAGIIVGLLLVGVIFSGSCGDSSDKVKTTEESFSPWPMHETEAWGITAQVNQELDGSGLPANSPSDIAIICDSWRDDDWDLQPFLRKVQRLKDEETRPSWMRRYTQMGYTAQWTADYALEAKDIPYARQREVTPRVLAGYCLHYPDER